MRDTVIWLVVPVFVAAVAAYLKTRSTYRARSGRSKVAAPAASWRGGRASVPVPRTPAVVLLPVNPPPGWYIDPEHPASRRWWTGAQWGPPAPR